LIFYSAQFLGDLEAIVLFYLVRYLSVPTHVHTHGKYQYTHKYVRQHSDLNVDFFQNYLLAMLRLFFTKNIFDENKVSVYSSNILSVRNSSYTHVYINEVVYIKVLCNKFSTKWEDLVAPVIRSGNNDRKTNI
jgi:hypothetical protein